MPGQHDVLHGAFHGVHLLRGGSQEGQGPDALFCAGVAEVATLVFLPVAVSDGELLKTGVVRCCVGQCSNAIPMDTVLTMKKLSITYVCGLGSHVAPCRVQLSCLHCITCELHVD